MVLRPGDDSGNVKDWWMHSCMPCSQLWAERTQTTRWAGQGQSCSILPRIKNWSAGMGPRGLELSGVAQRGMGMDLDMAHLIVATLGRGHGPTDGKCSLR